MFHTIRQEKSPFKSNPPLEPRFVVDLSIREDGSPINVFLLKERSNKGLVGCHFDPSTMSLRARLARGVELQKVNYGIVENDPNVITAKARKVVSQLEASAQSRAASEPVSEPSNPE